MRLNYSENNNAIEAKLIINFSHAASKKQIDALPSKWIHFFFTCSNQYSITGKHDETSALIQLK